MSRQPPAEAVAPSAPGVGRAIGAVVAPGLDPLHHNVAPAYPEAALRRGEQGAVGLDLSISAQGRVVSVVVARSSGVPALDAAAREAVAAWRFRPATANGQPVPGALRTTVHFRL
jgi:protein TonB